MALLSLPPLKSSYLHLPNYIIKPPTKTLLSSTTTIHKHQNSALLLPSKKVILNNLCNFQINYGNFKRKIPTMTAKTENRENPLEPDVVMKTKCKLWDVFSVCWMIAIHSLCLFAPFTFSWNAFWVAFWLYIITGLFGITLCYHRLLSHKSFKLPKWLEYLFAYCGVLAGQVRSILYGKSGKTSFKELYLELNSVENRSLVHQTAKMELINSLDETFSIKIGGNQMYTFREHRSTMDMLSYMLVFFKIVDPIFWVSVHRHHHMFVDSEEDTHSPINGFWFSHVTWFFDNVSISEKCGKSNNVGDLEKQPLYKFLESTYLIHLFALCPLLYAIGGLPYVVWGMGVRMVCVYHVTWSVNSVSHIWGKKAWNNCDLSKNNWWLALLTFGESWHNNHHAFEYSARHGLEWWQIDTTWYLIRLLEIIGLATHVKLPTLAHKQKMALTN